LANKNLDVKGLEDLLKALDEAPQKAKPIMERAMGRSLELVEGVVKEYPPQPARTRARTFNTYERGFGHYPKSAFVGGTINAKGKRAARKAGKVRMTSERLGTKWTSEVEITDDQVLGVIGNTASYAREVQGDYQTKFHAATGWVTLDQGIEQVEEDIYATFEEGADELANWIQTA